MKPRLIGKRVVVRPLVPDDAASLHENINDYDIYKYTLTIPHPYKLSDAEWFINHAKEKLEQKKSYDLGIELKETGKIIGGMAICHIDEKHDAAEVGYWLGKKYWGQSITSESLELLMDFAFNELKLHRLYANTFIENIASQRVLEKAGFKCEGRRKEAIKKDGKYCDDFIYGLISSDYFAR